MLYARTEIWDIHLHSTRTQSLVQIRNQTIWFMLKLFYFVTELSKYVRCIIYCGCVFLILQEYALWIIVTCGFLKYTMQVDIWNILYLWYIVGIREKYTIAYTTFFAQCYGPWKQVTLEVPLRLEVSLPRSQPLESLDSRWISKITEGTNWYEYVLVANLFGLAMCIAEVYRDLNDRYDITF